MSAQRRWEHHVEWFDTSTQKWRRWHTYDNQHSAECARGFCHDRTQGTVRIVKEEVTDDLFGGPGR